MPTALSQTLSTEEERNQAIVFANRLEVLPVGEEAKEARRWLQALIKKTSDLDAPKCDGLFQRGESKPRFADELSFQVGASFLAFTIEHPDEAKDPEMRIRAGIAGVLKAYQSVLSLAPRGRENFLDVLAAKMASGKIEWSTREVMARCSDVPLSFQSKGLFKTSEFVYAPIEVSQPAKIKTKPFPKFRPGAITGRIYAHAVLWVVLGSAGKVTEVKAMKKMPYGLMDSCIAAAKTISFEPALKDGKAVAVLAVVEYSINVF